MLKKEKKTPFTVHIREDLLQRAKELAFKEKVSIRQVIETALEQFLKEQDRQLTFEEIEK